MKGFKSLLAPGLALGYAAMAFSLAARAPAQDLTTLSSDYLTVAFPVAAVNSSGEAIGDGGLATVIVREPDGTTTTFAPPGAVNAYAIAINNVGAVAGWYYDAGSVRHGFLRDAAGTIAVIEAPGAGNQLRSGTMVDSVNDAGYVSGHYFDSQGKTHGFVRDWSGDYFDFAPSGSTYVGVSLLSQNGEACGWYQDASSIGVGYVRDASGRITSFAAPGSASTQAAGINASGQITGTYTVEATGKMQGFIRNADGSFVTFALPGGTIFPSVIVGIADNGDVVGYYGSSGFHGFLRSAATGAITTFDDPDADHTHFDGTFPESVSGNETIGGNFSDDKGSGAGFILAGEAD
jgi:hypothetical protein